MSCSQCQGIEEEFSQKIAMKELSHYRAKGPDKTTRMLIEKIKEKGVEGLTLMDIGGGVGAIQHELLGAGVAKATDVEASTAYLTAAREEARRRGFIERVSYHYGNFVDLAADLPPADIITLDRVICCYPDMQKLVGLSAARARKLYGLVYPRDTWLTKLGLAAMNLFYRLKRSRYRGYVHPSKDVEAVVHRSGLKLHSYRRTLIWQVAVYTR